MTSEAKLSFNIVGGPSKFDLMLSLFDGNESSRRTIEFNLEGSRTPIVVAITSVQREDGSGESWNIQGWIFNDGRNFNVRGYFSTKHRRGWLTIEVPFHREMKSGKMETVIDPHLQLAVEQYADSLRR